MDKGAKIRERDTQMKEDWDWGWGEERKRVILGEEGRALRKKHSIGVVRGSEKETKKLKKGEWKI